MELKQQNKNQNGPGQIWIFSFEFCDYSPFVSFSTGRKGRCEEIWGRKEQSQSGIPGRGLRGFAAAKREWKRTSPTFPPIKKSALIYPTFPKQSGLQRARRALMPKWGGNHIRNSQKSQLQSHWFARKVKLGYDFLCRAEGHSPRILPRIPPRSSGGIKLSICTLLLMLLDPISCARKAFTGLLPLGYQSWGYYPANNSLLSFFLSFLIYMQRFQITSPQSLLFSFNKQNFLLFLKSVFSSWLLSRQKTLHRY